MFKLTIYISLLMLFFLNAATAQRLSSLVVNEILFNPAKDGYDYIEVYNNGNDSIDLSNFLLANRNATRDLASVRQITKTKQLLAPQCFALITANSKWVRQHYLVDPSAVICEPSSLPALPDDEGTVVLLRKVDSSIIEEFNYAEEWHFSLVDNPSGVALERINYNMPAHDRNNWTSASAASGYGTPGYQNSQFHADIIPRAEVTVTPAVFSPDNDGIDDYAFIHLQMQERGYAANVTIYDVNGRKIRQLIKNDILGMKNMYKWNGLGDAGKPAARGIYIVYTQIFNLQGRVKKFKHVIVLNHANQ